MAPTRVGYIGTDHHHRDPYFQIASNLPVEITAVCEPGRTIDMSDLAPLEDRPDEITSADNDVASVAADATIYDDPEDVIAAGDVDAIWITYANDAVPGIVESAVEHGVDVISEKPIARTAEELATVARKANESGVTITPTYFYRANPIVEDLREKVRDGTFGDVWSVDGRFVGSQLSYRNTDHYIYDSERSRGGALQWIGLHWVDMMMYVLDDPIARINAQMAPAEDVDVEAGATLQFETEGGTMGTFQSGYYLSDRGKDTHLGLYGTDAQCRTPVHHDAMAEEPYAPLEITSGSSEWRAAPTRTTNYEFAYDEFAAWGDYVLEYFDRVFAGIRGEREVPAGGEDAVRMLRVLDAAYESAETEQWVDVPEPFA